MPVQEFFLTIIVDKDVNEDIYRRVFESLDKIDGITERSISVETNCITASAKWEESDISRKVEQIRNIKNVIKVDYNKRVNRSIIEPTVQVLETVSNTTIKDPIGEVNRARTEQDYFKAISYSSTVFEYYGKQILVWHFKKNNTPVSKEKLETFSLVATIISLYTHKIIDDGTKIKLLKVTHLRNKFIHQDYAVRLSSDQIIESKRTTDVALESLNILKTIYDGMAEVQPW
jgi:hypothetical protein